MDKIVHVQQFHPLGEEDLFNALFDISNACEVVAALYADNYNMPDLIRQQERNNLIRRLKQAINSAAVLGISGIPVEMYEKYIMVARRRPAHIFSDRVYDLNSPRLWEMLDKYQDENAEIVSLYKKFFRVIQVAMPDYILFRDTGVAGLHIPGLI